MAIFIPQNETLASYYFLCSLSGIQKVIKVILLFFSINSCRDKNPTRTNQCKEGKIHFWLMSEGTAHHGREGTATGAAAVGSHLGELGRRKEDALAFS